MTHRYMLDGHKPVKCPDLMTWAKWFETSGAERTVKVTTIGNVEVSTVFIGLDMSFADESPRQLFETMVFGGEYHGRCLRCATWMEAELQHDATVASVSQ